MIKISNDTLHNFFVKHESYQTIHYVHVCASYPLPKQLSQSFKKIDELITLLMHTSDKQFRKKITGQVKWSLKYNEVMDLVELWLLIKT